MPLVNGIDEVRYTGADISVSVVEDNRLKFPGQADHGARYKGESAKVSTTASGSGVVRRPGGFGGAVFVQADLVEGLPPSVDGIPYDLVFVRSVGEACFSFRTICELCRRSKKCRTPTFMAR